MVVFYIKEDLSDIQEIKYVKPYTKYGQYREVSREDIECASAVLLKNFPLFGGVVE
jgi:hypothetical protein